MSKDDKSAEISIGEVKRRKVQPPDDGFLLADNPTTPTEGQDEIDKILWQALAQEATHIINCTEHETDCTPFTEKIYEDAKQALTTLIAKEIEEIIGEDVELRDPDDHLPNAYMYLKGKNELRAVQRQRAINKGYKIGE